MNTEHLRDIHPVAAFPEELASALERMGHQKFRGKQIFSWIQNRSVADPRLMTNLPKDLRDSLVNINLEWPAKLGEILVSSDGTRKIELILNDGTAVETVLIPEGDKITQCVSSQVGCPVRCEFCRSGSMGFKRNLTAAEIVSQVHLARAYLQKDEQLRNVVFMGIGEPLYNTEAVLRTVSLLCNSEGLNLSTRRVTVSTVGIAREIDNLGEKTRGAAALAVSLHASNQETRDRLVPGCRDSLKDILSALKHYPLPARRRFTIEYVLVKGINDSKKDALGLVKLLSSIPCKVNLLPLNPHDKTELLPPDENTVKTFQETMAAKGMSVFLRRRRGADIGAACGQLLSVGKEA